MTDKETYELLLKDRADREAWQQKQDAIDWTKVALCTIAFLVLSYFLADGPGMPDPFNDGMNHFRP